MAENSLLSARIDIDLKNIQQGVTAIQKAIGTMNDAADFNTVKDHFSDLANNIGKSANVIQTEIKKLTNEIDLSQISKSLQGLDANVKKITESIDSYMEKMTTSMSEANKADLSSIKEQLAAMQESISKFTALTQSQDFLEAFKGSDVQKAASALRDYATALKSISSIDLSKLTAALKKLSAAPENAKAGVAGVDISGMVNQLQSLARALDDLSTIDKKITKVISAMEKLSDIPETAEGGDLFAKLNAA